MVSDSEINLAFFVGILTEELMSGCASKPYKILIMLGMLDVEILMVSVSSGMFIITLVGSMIMWWRSWWLHFAPME